MIKKFASHIREYKKPALMTVLVTCGEVLLDVSLPFVMSRVVDVGIANSDTAYIIKLGLLMIAMALVSLALGALAAKYSSTASSGFAKNLRNDLFSKVQEFSFSNVDKFGTASLVTRLTADVQNTQNAFMMSIRLLVRAPLMLLFAVIMAVTINVRLSVIFVVAVPVLSLLLVAVMFIARPRFEKMMKQYDNMNSAVQENLIGMRVVKAFVRGEFEKEKFKGVSERVRVALVSAEKIAVCIMPVMQMVVYGCLISLIWFGGNQVVEGTFEIGKYMSFQNYIMQILISLMMLGMVFMMLVISRASLTRIVEVLDEEPDIVNPPEKAVTAKPSGSIEFRDVVFRYKEGSGEPVLNNINLSIKEGETIGIVGSTGSAKTTLVQLIPRLYDVVSGSILVGGHDVREYDLLTLRDSVAMVLQNNVLFTGTIRDNLKWGDSEAADEEIAAACRIAQAHEFIMGLPNGYDTDLGQGGVNVSGGQKQRLCIARALLKKPSIMILDDSTSAVDTHTDSKLRKGLKESLEHMTTIIIAQRVASIMDADRIIVMEDGKIAEEGTHDELISRNGVYKEIYTIQTKGDNAYGEAR